MSDRLAGRRAVVSGAARGLGLAFATALSDAGASVVGCDVRDDVIDAGTANGFTGVVADAGELADVETVVGRAVEVHGGLDLLVNNASTALVLGPELSLAEAADGLDRQLHDNVRSAYLLGRAALPHLRAAGGGDLVNISTDHVVPNPSLPPKTGWMDAYDATKWALEGFTRNWAATQAEHGIRVNAISMGETHTPMLYDYMRDKGVDITPELTADWLDPAAIAELLVALVAEGPDGRTGQNIGCWPGHPVRLP